jgi:arsenical pump membrane protein
VLTFAAAAGATAILSLDATVVLLTPVVFATATNLRLRAKPHVYACAHLANSASTLLPVSNLTNLLAFSASGLTFAGFTALMALPWLVTIAIELVVFLKFLATDLVGKSDREPETTPVFALVVLALTLAGFGLGPLAGVKPVWVATAAALVLAVRGLARRTVRPWALSSRPPRCCVCSCSAWPSWSKRCPNISSAGCSARSFPAPQGCRSCSSPRSSPRCWPTSSTTCPPP